MSDHPEEELSALLDGELDGHEAEVVRAHVVACADCSAELDAVRSSRAALRCLPAVDPPAGFVDGLLVALCPDDRRRPRSGLRRPALLVNAAAAVVVGFLLVGATSGGEATAVAPEVDGALERHASTLSAMAVGLGSADPLLRPGAVPASTLPRRRADRLPSPFDAPEVLAGYRLAGAFQGPSGVHLLYERGRHALSVFEQEGELDAAALSTAEGEHLRVGGHDAWRWAGDAEGRVLVMERGALVVTFVGDESGEAVRAAAEAFPGPRRTSWGTRVRKACGEALDGLSPAG